MAPTDKIPVVDDELKKEIKDEKKPIINHKLVPPHRIITDEEKQKLLEKYDIGAKQLPKISIKDAAVQSLDEAKPGDVVEIKRSSTTAGTAVYYRVIING